MKPDAKWEKPAITQVTRGGRPRAGGGERIMGYSVRTERYRYTEWDGGDKGSELYDHETDPLEMKNLAGDAKQAELLKKMKALLPKAPAPR
jgi:uncharacterized sulfatase